MSLTTVEGGPRIATIPSSSRATRSPDSEVSATRPRHSRVQLSITHTTRKRRPSDSVFDAKSKTSAGWDRSAARSASACPSPLATAATTHLQPFLPIQPAQLLVFSGTPLRASNRPRRRYPNRRARPPRPAAAPASPHRPAEAIGIASPSDRPKAPGTDARSPRAAHADAPRPLAARRASPFFSGHVFQHGFVQHGVRQQLLQQHVLRFQLPQPARLGHPPGRRTSPSTD